MFMETKKFKALIERNSGKINLEKCYTAFCSESKDSIVFLILRKSGYSNKYYLRLKAAIKPLENGFEKKEYIKHDVGEIILSIDSESPELFDLGYEMADSERAVKLDEFFANRVQQWIKVLLSKDSIIDKFTQDDLFLLPYTKQKLGLK